MITRPLDLASKLRPEPRNFDFLFLVNGGLIVLFFLLFESRFVLAPGLGVDFQLPVVPGAHTGAVQTTHRITVQQSGLIINENGPTDLEGLNAWLVEKAKDPKTRNPSLLIIASSRVSHGLVTDIATAAHKAGFVNVQVAAEEPAVEKR